MFIHETSIVDDNVQIGEGTKIWHFSHIMSNCSIGENCNLGQNVVISPNVVLGNNVKIQNNVSVYTGVVCENDVFIGPSVVFTNIINPRAAINRKEQFRNTMIRQGATIGANATIVCGITLEKFCFIGAGSVVTKDVKPYELVFGNPAKHKGWMSEFGHKLTFINNVAICRESNEKYRLENGKVKKEDFKE